MAARRADRRPAAAAGRVPQLQAPGRPRPGADPARTRRTPRSRRSSRCSTPSTGPASTATSTSGFQAVADQLERIVAGLGLTKFGEPGDPFDPTIHEALSHIGEDPDVEVTTCKVSPRPATGSATGWCAPRRCWWSTRRARRSTRRDDDERGRCAHELTTTASAADWATKDFYEVLGVDKDATRRRDQEGLPQARARQPPRLQPRRHAKHDKFKAVAEAYDVVGDPEKRKKYDEMPLAAGSGGFGPGMGGGGGGSAAAGSTSTTCCATAAAGGGFGDMFGDLFGGGGRRARTQQARPRRGRRRRDARATIGFTDALEGVTISLRLTSDAPCPTCSGHRRQARHQAAHLPRVRGRRLRRRRRPAARSRSTRPARPAAAASSSTTSPAPPATAPAAACRRARSRPGSRPGSRTASGSGSRARARRARTAARPATCSSPSR